MCRMRRSTGSLPLRCSTNSVSIEEAVPPHVRVGDCFSPVIQ